MSAAYGGLLRGLMHHDDDMIVLSRPREIIKEDQIPTMTANELRAAKVAVVRLLAAIDGRLDAIAASDDSADDPVLALRVREAKDALKGGKQDAELQRRVEQAKRALETVKK